MSNLPKYAYACLLAAAALLGGGFPASAAAAPSLGTASTFAVLSAAPSQSGAVSCEWSVISGAVGSSGDASSVVLSTLHPCTISGTISAPVASQAVTDFNTAYDQYPSLSCTPGAALNAEYIGATVTLGPGVYCIDGNVSFTNATLTLDAQGDSTATWIFKIGGTLSGSNFSVVMANGGQYSNVYWWTAGAVTMETTTDFLATTDFQGTILSGGDTVITNPVNGPAGGATLFNGSVLAKGKVTLTNVTVTGVNPSRVSKSQSTCNQGVGNGAEGCDPGNSATASPFGSNDENGGVPGNPGRKGSSK